MWTPYSGLYVLDLYCTEFVTKFCMNIVPYSIKKNFKGKSSKTQFQSGWFLPFILNKFYTQFFAYLFNNVYW